MENKEPIKIKLSTVIIVIAIIVIIILGYFLYTSYTNGNQKDNEIAELSNQVKSLQNTVNDKLNENNSKNEGNESAEIDNKDNNNTLAENKTKDTDNTVKESTENERTIAIKEIKDALNDEEWVEENLYIETSCFGEKISKKEEQIQTFKVVDLGEKKAPVIVVQTNCEEALTMEIFFVRYNNNKVEVDLLEPVHNSHVGYEINDDILISEYGQMGSWNYEVYKINEQGQEIIESDEGEILPEEDDYTELNNITEKYDAKPITTKLNKSNISKYVK